MSDAAPEQKYQALKKFFTNMVTILILLEELTT